VAPVAASNRTPLRLVAVLDKSGSMRIGGKLKLVQKTMRFMLRHLGEQDQLGIVEYDTEVRVLAPLTQCDADGRGRLDSALAGLRPGSQTNLSGGLLKGLDLHQASTDLQEAAVRSTFLFTDGLANMGIVNTDALCAAAQGALEQLGDRRCTLSCFGFGADHSAALLQGLAELGGGLYSYVESEDQIGQAFGEALGGLLSTTHQNVQLSLKLAPGVSVARVCTDFACERREEDGAQSLVIEAGDLFAEERRDILLMLALPPAADADCDQVLGQSSVRAFSVVTNRFEVAGPVELLVGRAADADVVESDPHVERHRSRFITTEALTAARRQAERGDLSEARKLLSGATSTLSASALGAQGDSAVAGLIASLDDCRKDLQDQQRYCASGDKKMMMMQMAHSRQRGMNSGFTEVYGTSATQGMKSHFKSNLS